MCSQMASLRRSSRLRILEAQRSSNVRGLSSSQDTLIDSASSASSDVSVSSVVSNNSTSTNQSDSEEFNERRVRRINSMQFANRGGNSRSRSNNTNGHLAISGENQIRDNIQSSAVYSGTDVTQNIRAPLQYPCPVHSCSGLFNSAKAIKDHLNNVHIDIEGHVQGYPRCDRPGCKQFFSSLKALAGHKRSMHPLAPSNLVNPLPLVAQFPPENEANPPIRPPHACPFPTCSRNYPYANAVTLLHHLNDHHRTEELNPGNLLNDFVRCSITGCGHFCRGATGVRQHHGSAHPNIVLNPSPGQLRMQIEDDVEIEIASKDILQPFCNMALKRVHKTWLSSFQKITHLLQQEMALSNRPNSEDVTLAYFILPGLISRLTVYRGKDFTRKHLNLPAMPTPVDTLSRFLEGNPGAINLARRILVFATRLQQVFPLPPTSQRHHVTVDSKLRSMVKRAEHHAADGELSKAVRILDSMETLLSTTNLVGSQWIPPPEVDLPRELERLFPEGSLNDDLGDPDTPDPSFAAIQLEEEQVRKTLQTRDINKAKGRSGWTNHLLKSLVTRGSEQDISNFVSSLTRVFNLILSGRAPAAAHEFWTTARVSLQPKSSDPTGQQKRPIAIGEVLYRCLGSTVIHAVKDRVAAVLAPRQLGVGVKGGVEIAATCIDIGSLSDAIINEDISNAFGELNRKYPMSGLEIICKDIIAMYRWHYGRAIALCDDKGSIVHHASTGVLQGDPLSSLYFSAGIHALLLRIENKAHELADEIGAPKENVMVVAILDDISTVCPPRVAFALAPYIEEFLADMNLRLNKSKSFILGGTLNRIGGAPDGWNISTTFAKSLGRPLGDPEAQELYVNNELAQHRLPVQALKRIDPLYAVRLLKFCYAHKWDYLYKVVSNDVNHRVFDSFRTDFEDTLRQILAVDAATWNDELYELRSQVIQLPTHLGGLGISLPAVNSLIGARQRLLTWHRGLQFLNQHHPHLVEGYSSRFNPTTFSDLACKMNEIADNLRENEAEDYDITTYSMLTNKALGSMMEDLQKFCQVALVQRNAIQAAAQFLSYSHPFSCAWLTQRYDPLQTILPRRTGFRELCRQKLFVPFVSHRIGEPTSCDCGERLGLNLQSQPYHPLACRKNNNCKTNQHNELRDRFVVLANALQERPGESIVTIEPQDFDGAPFTGHRPDVRITAHNMSFYIDFTVVEPTAPSVLQACESHLWSGRAAEFGETRKRAQYSTMPPNFKLIPFSVESTGRLGREAAALLGKMCCNHPRLLRAFLRDLSCILARHSGLALSFSRSRLIREISTNQSDAGSPAEDLVLLGPSGPQE